VKPFLPVALMALSLLAACGAPQEARAPVAVEDAWVRLPAVVGRPGSAYFTLRAGDAPMRIVAVTSPQVERIELHETSHEGGVMRMGPLSDRDLPAGSATAFEPGGRHAMLFGIDPAVEPGGSIRLTFRFDPEHEVTAEAEVRAPGGMPAEDHPAGDHAMH